MFIYLSHLFLLTVQFNFFKLCFSSLDELIYVEQNMLQCTHRISIVLYLKVILNL